MTLKPSTVHTLIGIAVGIVLFLLTFGVEQYYRLHVSNFRSRDGKEHAYNIYPGMTIDSVLTLIRQDYEISGEADLKMHMKLIAIAHPEPGHYEFPAQMGDKSFINRLKFGEQTPILLKWTNSVRTREELAEKVGSQLMIESEAILKMLEDDSYMAQFGMNKETSRCLFIPNTYEVYWTISPEALFQRMEREYKVFWNNDRRQKAEKKGLTPIEVAILASIVECETYIKKDMPTIASLYMNRLRIGMPLQACPTIKYALGDFEIKRVLNRHLKVDSPYNTYKNKGLPPGPIRCPLPQTMDFVLNAPETNYLYMCANPALDGTHIFSSSYGTHASAARSYHKTMDQMHIK